MDTGPSTVGNLSTETLGKFTDLYEKRMTEGYLATDHTPEATFSLFFRALPPDRGYIVDSQGDDQSPVDFGSRRAHGTDAGVKAARAAYLGGFDGTSNLATREVFDVPVFGTMAHS